MINKEQLEKKLLESKKYLKNYYFEKYLELIYSDKNISDDEYIHNHHIIPYHILKKQNIHIYDQKFIKKLKISDHIIAHYYLFKCSIGIEKNANINSINLLLNEHLDDKYFKNISDKELYLLAQTRDCLRENIRSVNSARNKGKIYINNGQVSKKIYPQDLESWIKKGWMKGGLKFTEEHKQKLRKKKPMSEEAKIRLKGRGKGKITVFKDNKLKKIDPENLSDYINNGWIKSGKPKTEEQKQHLSKINKGKHLSIEHREKLRKTNTGYTYMHKGNKERHVYAYQLNKFIEDGWEYGRAEIVKNKIRDTERLKNGKI